MMRRGEGLSKKENLREGSRRKTCFEEDLDTSSEDICANNFNRDGENEFLSIGDTEEDSDQIIIEHVKIDDIEINDYVLVKFRSKKNISRYIASYCALSESS